MDVQTENMDPPPCESQPSGKIRKGFKLFGKHKPGNIFSIRSKGDGNNKSPVTRSKAEDGASETAPDSEQEPDKEKGREASVAERERAEEEPLGEDGVLAAAPARTSISSASSAKSLSFLSRLRGGRRGAGDRRAHTVSQPTGRQRRGLKGLFGNVRCRSKDKDDKEDSPPSPLLMSSRANSVEIIKEDLTLTPKSQPRSLDSPEAEPAGSLAAEDGEATSPSEAASPHVAAGTVSRTERASPLPGSELPLAPGDTSLSSLLADISSLLTFDSISGGGDIMADVEAEWGKVSSALSAEVPPPCTSPLPKAAAAPSPPVKPPHVSVPAASSQYFAPLTKMSSFSPAAKPRSELAQPLTPTPPSVNLSSDSTVSEPSTSIRMKSAPAAAKPSTHVALTSPSAPITSSSSTLSPAPPPNTQATAVKAPSVSPVLTRTATKPASENAAPARVTASVGRPAPAATPAPPAKPPPVTHSPPSPAPPPKPDSVSSFQASTSHKPSLNAAAGESKAPAPVSARAALTTPASPEPVSPSETTVAPTSTTASASVAPPKSTLTSTKTDVNKTSPPLVTLFSSTPTTTAKAPPGPPSVPAPPAASSDKTPCVTKPTPAPAALDMTPPAPAPTPFATTRADLSPAPPDLGRVPVVQFKAPPASVLNNSSAPPQVHAGQPKAPPAPAHTSAPVSKEHPVSAQLPVSGPKEPPPPVHIPASVCKDPPVPAQTSVSLSKDPCVPAHRPVASPPATSPPWSATGSGPASVDGQLTSPSSTDAHGAQAVWSKTDKLQNESRTSLQGSREKRAPQVKASGLSKIPVVGGGRGGKPPVSQQGDDEASRVPPSPVLQEDRPPFYPQDADSREHVSAAEVQTPKGAHEGSLQPPQPKVPASSPRDSKIPVKHGAQSHAASHVPQAKEPQRSKIPVSKVPVRAAAKPAAAAAMRK